MPRKYHFSGVSMEAFIHTYNNSRTSEEVADKLGMTKRAVIARAYLYRCRGYTLKKLRLSGDRYARSAILPD